ncbi:MAG: PilZ domain-containing protein [Oscillospiraceae bacterium]|nr:PilZ domain-containing protein [Oscillospiraceae bacterium]
MINKDKISTVLVYDDKGNLLVKTKSVSFPRDFFGIRGKDLVMLKGAGFPPVSRNEHIEVVFEYINGTRVKYKTVVDLSTEYQMNFHVGEGEAMEERRRSFKINVELAGVVHFYMRDEQVFSFDEPIDVEMKNINLGGVFFRSEYVFEKGDQVMLSFLDGKMEFLSDILRVQMKTGTDEVDGYGCRFLNVTPAQEEQLAKFIFDCQIAEREKRKSKSN